MSRVSSPQCMLGGVPLPNGAVDVLALMLVSDVKSLEPIRLLSRSFRDRVGLQHVSDLWLAVPQLLRHFKKDSAAICAVLLQLARKCRAIKRLDVTTDYRMDEQPGRGAVTELVHRHKDSLEELRWPHQHDWRVDVRSASHEPMPHMPRLKALATDALSLYSMALAGQVLPSVTTLQVLVGPRVQLFNFSRPKHRVLSRALPHMFPRLEMFVSEVSSICPKTAPNIGLSPPPQLFWINPADADMDSDAEELPYTKAAAATGTAVASALKVVLIKDCHGISDHNLEQLDRLPHSVEVLGVLKPGPSAPDANIVWKVLDRLPNATLWYFTRHVYLQDPPGPLNAIGMQHFLATRQRVDLSPVVALQSDPLFAGRLNFRSLPSSPLGRGASLQVGPFIDAPTIATLRQLMSRSPTPFDAFADREFNVKTGGGPERLTLQHDVAEMCLLPADVEQVTADPPLVLDSVRRLCIVLPKDTSGVLGFPTPPIPVGVRLPSVQKVAVVARGLVLVLKMTDTYTHTQGGEGEVQFEALPDNANVYGLESSLTHRGMPDIQSAILHVRELSDTSLWSFCHTCPQVSSQITDIKLHASHPSHVQNIIDEAAHLPAVHTLHIMARGISGSFKQHCKANLKKVAARCAELCRVLPSCRRVVVKLHGKRALLHPAEPAIVHALQGVVGERDIELTFV